MRRRTGTAAWAVRRSAGAAEHLVVFRDQSDGVARLVIKGRRLLDLGGQRLGWLTGRVGVRGWLFGLEFGGFYPGFDLGRRTRRVGETHRLSGAEIGRIRPRRDLDGRARQVAETHRWFGLDPGGVHAPYIGRIRLLDPIPGSVRLRHRPERRGDAGHRQPSVRARRPPCRLDARRARRRRGPLDGRRSHRRRAVRGPIGLLEGFRLDRGSPALTAGAQPGGASFEVGFRGLPAGAPAIGVGTRPSGTRGRSDRPRGVGHWPDRGCGGRIDRLRGGIELPVRLGGDVVTQGQAIRTQAERGVERQRTRAAERSTVDEDRTPSGGRRGDQAPGPPLAGQAAGFVGEPVVGQVDLAVGGAADPHGDPVQLHDANRPRFTILDVEASGFRHGGSYSSLSLARLPIRHPRSTNRSVPPASQRFQVPPRALAEIATAGSSTVQCKIDHRLNPTAAPIKP